MLTRHSATGFSPHFLMFGRHPRLPIDVCFGTHPHKGSPRRTHQIDSKSQYVSKLKKRMEWAFQQVQKSVAKEADRSRRYYDVKMRGCVLNVGDIVLVRTTGWKVRHKVQDRWENREYRVTAQPHRNIPVYRVDPVDPNSGGRGRMLHRNYLLPMKNIMLDDLTNEKPPAMPTFVVEADIHRDWPSETDDPTLMWNDLPKKPAIKLPNNELDRISVLSDESDGTDSFERGWGSTGFWEVLDDPQTTNSPADELKSQSKTQILNQSKSQTSKAPIQGSQTQTTVQTAGDRTNAIGPSNVSSGTGVSNVQSKPQVSHPQLPQRPVTRSQTRHLR